MFDIFSFFDRFSSQFQTQFFKLKYDPTPSTPLQMVFQCAEIDFMY